MGRRRNSFNRVAPKPTNERTSGSAIVNRTTFLFINSHSRPCSGTKDTRGPAAYPVGPPGRGRGPSWPDWSTCLSAPAQLPVTSGPAPRPQQSLWFLALLGSVLLLSSRWDGTSP